MRSRAKAKTARRRRIRSLARDIQRRIELFCALPLESLDRLSIERRTRAIGENP